MALYEGFAMTFIKMPKYLPTNKYQNKDIVLPPLLFFAKCGIVILTEIFPILGETA